MDSHAKSTRYACLPSHSSTINHLQSVDSILEKRDALAAGIDLRKKGLRMGEILIADNTIKISENKVRKERSLPGTKLRIHIEQRKAHLQ